MEKALYPSVYMRITQGYNEGTHKDSFAIDEASKDNGISKIRAPFTGIIKKIYKEDANEVWLESIDKVEYPDGTIDYMTVMFAHCNNIDSLFVGKQISQKEEFYSEGTKGNVTGNHCHIECGQGRFYATGWHKNSSGYYSINDGKAPELCFWLDDDVTIINSHGYNFQRIKNDKEPEIEADKNTEIEVEKEPAKEPEKVLPNEEKSNEDETMVEDSKTKHLIFTCQKKGLYRLYLKENQKVYLED